MRFPQVPRIKPPGENVKAYAEWGGVGIVALSWLTIAIWVVFWSFGKQSPIPIIADPPPATEKREERKAHRQGNATSKDIEKIKERDVPGAKP